MYPMRRALVLSVTLAALAVPGLAGSDQSGRVRRVGPPQGNSGSTAGATDTTEAPTRDASGAAAQPEKISVVVKCNARYDGGSLNLDQNQKLTVTVKDGILALNARGSSFEIPTSQVTDLTYAQTSRNRTAEGIGVGVVSPTAGVLLGHTQTKAHYIRIIWAGSPPGGVSLKIDKDDIRGVLAALEAATGIRSKSEGGAPQWP
jgi:hypothetical protein